MADKNGKDSDRVFYSEKTKKGNIWCKLSPIFFSIIIIPLGVNLLGGGLFPWLTFISNFSNAKHEVSNLHVIITLFVSIIIIILVVYIHYKIKLNHSEMYCKFHKLSHFLRNKIVYAEQHLKGKKNKNNECLISDIINNCCNDICDNIRNCFRAIIHGNSIEACIRLADKINTDPSSQDVLYVTYGRSSGLNKDKAETSTPVHANVGLPRFFLAKKKGALIINNIEYAANLDLFLITPNDRKYQKEIKSLIVCPINGWSGKKQDMIGLLYLCSSQTKVFKNKHIDMLLHVADITASILPRIVDICYQKIV